MCSSWTGCTCFSAGSDAGRPGACSYSRRGVCLAYLEYLREHSASLADRTISYFCMDQYVQCARFHALKGGMPVEQVGRLAPWDAAPPVPITGRHPAAE